MTHKEKLKNGHPCSFEGCKNKYYGRGFCRSHFQQNHRGEALTKLNGPTFKDITNQQFGRLSVMWPCGLTKDLKAIWLCLCDCGNIGPHCGNGLRNGNIRSCGCLQLDAVNKSNTTHGMTKTPEFNSYHGAKKRCNDLSDLWYGGRGVEFKFDSFGEFYELLGPKPTPKHSLDRIDPRGHYAPGNVRWADTKTQALNKRSSAQRTQDEQNALLVMYARSVSA